MRYDEIRLIQNITYNKIYFYDVEKVICFMRFTCRPVIKILKYI